MNFITWLKSLSVNKHLPFITLGALFLALLIFCMNLSFRAGVRHCAVDSLISEISENDHFYVLDIDGNTYLHWLSTGRD